MLSKSMIKSGWAALAPIEGELVCIMFHFIQVEFTVFGARFEPRKVTGECGEVLGHGRSCHAGDDTR